PGTACPQLSLTTEDRAAKESPHSRTDRNSVLALLPAELLDVGEDRPHGREAVRPRRLHLEVLVLGIALRDFALERPDVAAGRLEHLPGDAVVAQALLQLLVGLALRGRLGRRGRGGGVPLLARRGALAGVGQRGGAA